MKIFGRIAYIVVIIKLAFVVFVKRRKIYDLIAAAVNKLYIILEDIVSATEHYSTITRNRHSDAPERTVCISSTEICLLGISVFRTNMMLCREQSQ